MAGETDLTVLAESNATCPFKGEYVFVASTISVPVELKESRFSKKDSTLLLFVSVIMLHALYFRSYAHSRAHSSLSAVGFLAAITGS